MRCVTASGFASRSPFGPAGSAIVRTLWIVRTGEDVPRLTSAYPIR